jgi:hypothetical protein
MQHVICVKCRSLGNLILEIVESLKLSYEIIVNHITLYLKIMQKNSQVQKVRCQEQTLQSKTEVLGKCLLQYWHNP